MTTAKHMLYGWMIALLGIGVATAKPKGGILGKQAPEWEVEEWTSLPKGEKRGPQLKDFKGKTVYLYCFQSWCPGCHSSGFPTLQKVNQHFKNDEKVEFLVIQTVFEGFSSNTPAKGKATAKRYNLTHLPFAQSGTRTEDSQVMEAYRSRGTPWTIIIGPDGKVAYNDFHIEADKAIKLISKLKQG